MNQEENLVEEIFKKIESLQELNRVLLTFVWLIDNQFMSRNHEIYHYGQDAFERLKAYGK